MLLPHTITHIEHVYPSVCSIPVYSCILDNIVSLSQVVGVTNEELIAAQKWNVQGVLDLLKKKPL